MPKFVKVCKNDFTTFHNAMWRDPTLDYPERGLLGTMLTLPDNWNFSIKGLAALVPSGERKIGTSLKKIEKAGYLKREPIRSHGRIIDWKYSFSDEPIFRNENEKHDEETSTEDEMPPEPDDHDSEQQSTDCPAKSNADVENNVDNHVENSPESPLCQNSNVVNSQNDESPDCCFADVVSADVKKSISYQILSNQVLSNQNLSINQTETKTAQADVENYPDMIDEMDFEKAVADVENQIMTDRLRSERESVIIDEIVDIIASMFITKQRHRKIGGDKLSVSLIQRRLRQLDYEHILYVVDCLSGNTTEIKNRRSYLLTCLYNAPMTIDGYYANQVAHELYGS